MKQIIICITLIFTCLQISSCAELDKMSQANSFQTSDLGENNKVLKTTDFSISDDEDIIVLDSLYSELQINKKEQKLDNNYVGEAYFGDFIYKTYVHDYGDFFIYVSNTNYNTKNRNFDEYYITQITLETDAFKTYRNITIGSDVEDVIEKYGKRDFVTQEGELFLVYTLDDMEMTFQIDENQKVDKIVMFVLLSNVD